MKEKFDRKRDRKGRVIQGRKMDFDTAPIAVSDDDFEEYKEFLAWKKKHGLRATIRKMAKK